MTGYSDRINHAFAFAAKHHDRQVRKGTRLPYLTHPANVAVILTRYGCEEDTVIAGILHDVVEDCVREGWTREMLEDRIASKFGVSMTEPKQLRWANPVSSSRMTSTFGESADGRTGDGHAGVDSLVVRRTIGRVVTVMPVIIAPVAAEDNLSCAGRLGATA